MGLAGNPDFALPPELSQPLPAPISDPLHILQESSGCLWPWILLASLLLFLWWLDRKVRSRKAADAPRLQPSRSPTGHALVTQIRGLQREFVKESRFREGCHRLAELVRQLLGQGQLGDPLRESRHLTAREIRWRIGERPASRLLDALAELQFREDRPTREEFDGVCDLAVETVRGKGRR